MKIPSIVGEAVPGWGEKTIPPRVARRAYEKHLKSPEGCWVSTYSTQSAGYAQIGWAENGRTSMVLAHRASWTHVNGPIPAGYTIDHLCKEKRCVNPVHMRILSNFENGRRTAGREWPIGECINGHPNSMLEKSGARWVCRPCHAKYHREWARAKRASTSK